MQDLSKFNVPKNFRGRSGWYVQLWWIVRSMMFYTSPQLFYAWRRFILRIFGAKIGKNVNIRPSAQILYPWKLTIGDYSWIGEDVNLYNLDEIVIGNDVVISQKSYLCTGSHDYLSENFRIDISPILIEDKCWLATDVFVAPGVTIGYGSVIGARSSVFKSIPANKVCFGSPARPLKNRVVKEVSVAERNR
ncbi:putative colanic acid biosynthesis acetyltransferase [Spirosoma sp. KNUC1025]|uniref:putative colanic acid biosynthesis acetyltransferase n=1 Tax=Spirosoma sp. KNUC1025 TaxID=2894082 RepID=UPI003870B0BD|nr:putative colanic acid biosynthesis acetyltransferase [Spirosoma sp. KNUC1025]